MFGFIKKNRVIYRSFVVCFLTVICTVLNLIACSSPVTPETVKDTVITVQDNTEQNKSVKKVTFTGQTATVNFDDLNGNTIYLVKVNTSDLIVNAANTGGAKASSPEFEINRNNMPSYPLYETLPPMGHPAAERFHANPPPVPEQGPRRMRDAFIAPVVGDTRMYWVEEFYNNGKWVQKQATLRATGKHGNVWVMDENYDPVNSGGNKINTAKAQMMASKFDEIYPLATNILGYEYGGGPGGDGGMDGDPKIQILVYDIVNTSGYVAAGGYFWAKDFYPQNVNDLWGYKTNLAELFYVNTSTVNSAIDYTYSLMIHELQHMIHFNEKRVKRGLNYSATWYNEMLSMMAEDVIAPLVGVDPTNWYHPIWQRIPIFLDRYHLVGVTEWDSSTNSYAKGYAFGAYLTRNYGGPVLLKRILANNTTDIVSVTSALNEFSPGMNFNQVLARYGEAMVFCGSQIPKDVMTFDKTVTSSINGFTYTAYRIDLWNMNRTGMVLPDLAIFGLTPITMRPHSVSLHSTNEWKNRTGNYSITLEKPADSNIEMYLLVK